MLGFMHGSTFVFGIADLRHPCILDALEANRCNAFVLILLTCGIPRVRMRSRQIVAISLVAGLRIHAVWMRCKLLQLGRKKMCIC